MKSEQACSLPDATRVACRAITLATVACRGFAEAHSAEAIDFWVDVRAWYHSLGIDNEIEPCERAVFEAPLGTLSPDQATYATWQSEGSAVLGWALRRLALPIHDVEIDPQVAADSLGFLAPRNKTVLFAPTLLPIAELIRYSEATLSVHWRLREFWLRPTALDFCSFAKSAWFGPLSLEGVRMIDGDLAIGNVPIFRATPAAIQQSMNIAQERHRAINWLLGGHALYSQVEIGT